MKAKLQNLATKAPKVSEALKGPSYPSLSLNSKEHDGLEGITLGSHAVLTFEAEVTATRQPDPWEKESQGLKDKDVVVAFKLLKGSVEHDAAEVALKEDAAYKKKPMSEIMK